MIKTGLSVGTPCFVLSKIIGERQTGRGREGRANRQTGGTDRQTRGADGLSSDKWIDRNTNRRTDRQDVWTDRKAVRKTIGRMSRQMDGWMDGWMDRQTYTETQIGLVVLK
jgi:hypothetical protein